jgi:hypothetical protein
VGVNNLLSPSLTPTPAFSLQLLSFLAFSLLSLLSLLRLLGLFDLFGLLSLFGLLRLLGLFDLFGLFGLPRMPKPSLDIVAILQMPQLFSESNLSEGILGEGIFTLYPTVHLRLTGIQAFFPPQGVFFQPPSSVLCSIKIFKNDRYENFFFCPENDAVTDGTGTRFHKLQGR